MFWIKGCPRCNGDLYEEKDIYSRFVACIQCGHYLNEVEEAAIRHSPSSGLLFQTKRADRADQIAVRPRVEREVVASAA